jgi:hypothetical protein
MTSQCSEHSWAALSAEDVAEIRRKTRTGRPNGAWLENVSRCSNCGAMEAGVSWYGQLHHVAVTEETPGSPVVRWPTRQTSPGSSMGMG